MPRSDGCPVTTASTLNAALASHPVQSIEARLPRGRVERIAASDRARDRVLPLRTDKRVHDKLWRGPRLAVRRERRDTERTAACSDPLGSRSLQAAP